MNPSKSHLIKSFITFVCIVLFIAGAFYALTWLKTNNVPGLNNFFAQSPLASSETSESTTTSASVFTKDLKVPNEGCIMLDLDPTHLEKGTLLDRSSNYRVLKVATPDYPELYLVLDGEVHFYKINEGCAPLSIADIDPSKQYEIAMYKTAAKPTVGQVDYDGKVIPDGQTRWESDLVVYVY